MAALTPDHAPVIAAAAAGVCVAHGVGLELRAASDECDGSDQ